jgi:tetraacyldisaccharide 4'-kinase
MLSLVAWIYGRGIALRNYLYDKGIFEVHDPGARVISVGNITVGGTGKTPLVAYIAAQLAEQGEKVCIVTRGYGRQDESRRVLVSDGGCVLADAATGGDEPVELAQKLLGKAIVIADADRAGAAEWARRKFDVTAFVLDDGFQHRKVKRDVDIVCVDATDPFGDGKLLPAGKQREPVESLARADVVVITRLEQFGDASNLRSEISDLAPDAVVVGTRTTLLKIREMTRSIDTIDQGEVPGLRHFAFCGLGNPGNFFDLLQQSSVTVLGRRAFRDHHRYTQQDAEEIEHLAAAAGADALITTAKDAVKLAEVELSLPCYIAEIAIEVDDPNAFRRALSR